MSLRQQSMKEDTNFRVTSDVSVEHNGLVPTHCAQKERTV
jgi:hypothetical protein